LKVLSSEPTKVKATFTPNGFVPDVNEFFGIVRIEPALQQAFDIDEASTLRGNAPNPRIANCTISQDGSNLVVEAETVPANLEAGQEYNVSARLGLNEEPNQRGFSEGFDQGFG
jgi:hypothetical protein